MARIPELGKEQLSVEALSVYEEIEESRGSVAREWTAFLHSPDITGRLSRIGEYVRYHGPVSDVIKEVAILVAAREMDNDFIWTGHEVLARNAGVTESVIDAIRARRAPQDGTPEENAVARFVQQLLRDHRVTDEIFQQVHNSLGDQGVIDVTMAAGYYIMMSMGIAALEVAMPEGRVSTLSH